MHYWNRLRLGLTLTVFIQSVLVSGAKLNPDEVLDIETVKPKGEYYEATVPDTLDLAKRAEYSVNVLTYNAKPPKYNTTIAFRFAPDKVETHPGGNLLCKNLRALPMLRSACGSTLNMNIELAIMRDVLEHTAEDGQIYPDHDSAHPEEASLPWYNGLAALAMLNWYDRDGNSAWLDWVGLICQGMMDVVIEVDDRAYWPPECSLNRDGSWNWTLRNKPAYPYQPPEEPTFDQQGYEGAAKFEQAPSYRSLVKYYELTGDQAAMEMARKVSRFVLKPGMWEDTSEQGYPGYEHGMWAGHVHANAANHHALLDLAVADDDEWLKQFVREAYDHSVRNGVIRMGWFPSWTLPEKYRRHAPYHSVDAPCAIADILVLAVKLTDAGLGDYWDDVDAIVRNHLSTHQFTDLERMRACAGGSTEHDELLKKFIGAFNQGYKTYTTPTVASCCTANGAIGLYYAWHGITRFDDGVATVNLLLNRASAWMDIDSYLPYEGKVVLHNKKAHTAIVRIPLWAPIDQVECSVNGAPTKPVKVGRRLMFGKLMKGDTITLEFPVVEHTDKYLIYDEEQDNVTVPPTEFTLTFRGSTLIDISPRKNKPGTYAFYERDHYKAKQAPMVQVTRFATDKVMPLQ